MTEISRRGIFCYPLRINSVIIENMRSLGKLLVWCACAIIVAALVYSAVEKASYPLEFKEVVIKNSNDNNIPRNLVMAVIREESRFSVNRESSAGAKGLMQLMPKTAAWIAVTREISYDPNTLSDPEVNINLGSWYIRYLLNQFQNDNTLALEAYNAGITNVKSWQTENQGAIQFKETEQFVKKVLKSKLKYDQLYGENWEKQK